MARDRRNTVNEKPVSLLIIEGDTEEIFYPLVAQKYLGGVRLAWKNLNGQGNTNRQVIGKIQLFLQDNPDDLVRTYCCIDTERNNQSATPLDLGLVRRQIIDRGLGRVLSVDAVLADPEIESWFFYDIEGIYRFLGMPRARRKPNKYRNVGSLGKRDLQRLFEQCNKVYLPGKRARHFIESLDLGRIVENCVELKQGIELITSRAGDTKNHLFR